MSSNHQDAIQHQTHGHGFPWSYIVGFALSLILTALALWLAVDHVLSVKAVIFVILVLAIVQIFVQLFFFMHFTEAPGPAYHSAAIALAFFFTFCIVAGSVWIMTFGSQVS